MVRAQPGLHETLFPKRPKKKKKKRERKAKLQRAESVDTQRMRQRGYRSRGGA